MQPFPAGMAELRVMSIISFDVLYMLHKVSKLYIRPSACFTYAFYLGRCLKSCTQVSGLVYKNLGQRPR